MPVTSLVTVLQWWQVDKISPVKLFEESKSVTGFQLRNLLRGACSPHRPEPPPLGPACSFHRAEPLPRALCARHTARSSPAGLRARHTGRNSLFLTLIHTN